MDPNIKEKWLAALRSGEYDQAKAVLKRIHPGDPESKPAYCCLGVLCEIAAAEGALPPANDAVYLDKAVYGEEDTWSTLPQAVMEWANLPSADPYVSPNAITVTRTTLSRLNDGGSSFSEIADIIERNL
jgi:hypothetical protein